MIKAFRNGSHSFFSERDWATGCPQRRGWEAEGKMTTEKKIPVKILEFSNMTRKPPAEVEDVLPDNLEDWKALLDELGIKYHPKAGMKKMKELYLEFNSTQTK